MKNFYLESSSNEQLICKENSFKSSFLESKNKKQRQSSFLLESSFFVGAAKRPNERLLTLGGQGSKSTVLSSIDVMVQTYH